MYQHKSSPILAQGCPFSHLRGDARNRGETSSIRRLSSVKALALEGWGAIDAPCTGAESHQRAVRLSCPLVRGASHFGQATFSGKSGIPISGCGTLRRVPAPAVVPVRGSTPDGGRGAVRLHQFMPWESGPHGRRFQVAPYFPGVDWRSSSATAICFLANAGRLVLW